MIDRLAKVDGSIACDRPRDRLIDRKPMEPANPTTITASPRMIKVLELSAAELTGGRDRITVGITIATLIGVPVGAGDRVMPGAGVAVGGAGVGVGGGGGNCNSP